MISACARCGHGMAQHSGHPRGPCSVAYRTGPRVRTRNCGCTAFESSKLRWWLKSWLKEVFR